MAKRFKGYRQAQWDLEDLVNSDSRISELKLGLEEGFVYRINHKIPLATLRQFREQLLRGLSYDDPGYVERKWGCQNNFRVHWDDSHQATRGKFMSWSFYPWNASSSQWFAAFKDLYRLRNKLAGLPTNTYIDGSERNFAARLAAQFYPSGAGYMDEHVDPYNVHQFAIPTLLLSTHGLDFEAQGFYVLNEDDEKVFIDEKLSFGDLFLFHTLIPHGVALVDPHLTLTQSSIRGRLMMIAAVNALHDQEKYQSSAKNG